MIPDKVTPVRDQQSWGHGLILSPTHSSAPAGMLRSCSMLSLIKVAIGTMAFLVVVVFTKKKRAMQTTAIKAGMDLERHRLLIKLDPVSK